MRIGIIGTGNMGTILAESLLDTQAISQDHVFITNRTIEKANKIKERFPNTHVLASAEKVVKNSDVIFVCLKPFDIYPLLEKINPFLTKEKCLVSITSPISVEQLESVCSCSCIRAIPSITNRALSGVCLLSFGASCTNEWKFYITELLSNIGKPIEIPNEITRVASDIVSCGPAFFSYIIQQFIQSAVRETKIDEELATVLASEMLIGLGKLLDKDFYTLQTLQQKVSVKGGITGEGIKVLEQNQLGNVFDAVFKATHTKFMEDLDHIKDQFEIHKV